MKQLRLITEKCALYPAGPWICVLSTGSQYGPQVTSWSSQAMRVLRQCKFPRAEVMLVTSQRENIRPSKKDVNKAVTMLPNCPMFAVRLWITTSPYRWPLGNLPSSYMLWTPPQCTWMHLGCLHHARINLWSVDSTFLADNKILCLTLWRRSSSKCYIRIQSVPQREHNTSPLERSTS
jgi:hypothetical protein